MNELKKVNLAGQLSISLAEWYPTFALQNAMSAFVHPLKIYSLQLSPENFSDGRLRFFSPSVCGEGTLHVSSCFSYRP